MGGEAFYESAMNGLQSFFHGALQDNAAWIKQVNGIRGFWLCLTVLFSIIMAVTNSREAKPNKGRTSSEKKSLYSEIMDLQQWSQLVQQKSVTAYALFGITIQ